MAKILRHTLKIFQHSLRDFKKGLAILGRFALKDSTKTTLSICFSICSFIFYAFFLSTDNFEKFLIHPLKYYHWNSLVTKKTTSMSMSQDVKPYFAKEDLALEALTYYIHYQRFCLMFRKKLLIHNNLHKLPQISPFKRQPHKTAKQTQTIRRLNECVWPFYGVGD